MHDGRKAVCWKRWATWQYEAHLFCNVGTTVVQPIHKTHAREACAMVQIGTCSRSRCADQVESHNIHRAEEKGQENAETLCQSRVMCSSYVMKRTGAWEGGVGGWGRSKSQAPIVPRLGGGTYAERPRELQTDHTLPYVTSTGTRERNAHPCRGNKQHRNDNPHSHPHALMGLRIAFVNSAIVNLFCTRTRSLYLALSRAHAISTLRTRPKRRSV